MRWTKRRGSRHDQGLVGHFIPLITDIFSGRRMKIFFFFFSSSAAISRSRARISYHSQESANPLFVLSLFLCLYLSQSPGSTVENVAYGPWLPNLDRPVETALISCGEELLQFLATGCKSLFYPTDRTKVDKLSEQQKPRNNTATGL